MRRRVRGFVVAIALAACAEGGADDGVFTVRDSAGIRIAESAAPAADALPTFAAEPRLDIGVREGSPEYLLGRVSAAVRRADGTIAVADDAAGVVRVYDADGAHLFSIGGAGDGPGEFRHIASLWTMPGDSLGIFDSRHRRVSVVAPRGDLVREITFSAQQMAVNALPLPDGAFLSVTPAPPRRDRPGTDGRPASAVVRYDGGGTLLDTVTTMPGLAMQLIEARPGRTMLGPVPFGGNSYIGIAGDFLVVGTAETCELRELRMDGTLAGTVRWPCDLALTEADVTRWKEHMLARAEAEAPGSVDQLGTYLDRTTFPASRAAYGEFLIGGDGSVWLPHVELPGSDPARWTVLDAKGRLLGDVTLPDRFVPLEIGRDYVLGRWSDELDVQHVRMYDIIRR